MKHASRLAVAAAVCCAPLAAAGPLLASPTQQSGRPPVPIPELYDPVPGPYVVLTDARGGVSEEQKAAIAHAFHSWSGTKLEAFTICFRPASQPVDWNAALAALGAVSRGLKGLGAKVVVMPASRLCDGPPLGGLRYGSRVEITGVIRA